MDGIDGNGFILLVEYVVVSDLNFENVGIGDVLEKRVGEKIVFFEGFVVV